MANRVVSLLSRLFYSAAKSGDRCMVPPTTPVLKLLDRIERSEGNPRVIRSQKPGAHLPDLAYYWGRIRDRAGLEGRAHPRPCTTTTPRRRSPWARA